MSPDELTLSVGQIVGQNLSRLREGERLTQSDLVKRIFERTGEVWTRGQLSTLENGKRESVTLDELLVLAHTFQVPLRELFSTASSTVGDLAKQNVVRAGNFKIALGDLQATLAGDLVVPAAATEHTPEAWIPLQTEADRAVADRLGVLTHVVIDAATQLWGHTLTEERDARLGDTSDMPPRTLQAKRGAMTRVLTAQIEARLRVDEEIDVIRRAK